jgi:lipoprotein-anchoring transpeptidase ErfK/SrfK
LIYKSIAHFSFIIMNKTKNKYTGLIDFLTSKIPESFLYSKIFVFSVVAIPLTSAGAGIGLYVDNLSNIAQDPVFLQETVIALDEYIEVEFAAPIRDVESYEKTISIYPNMDLSFTWNDVHNKVKIMPKGIWKPETKYSIAFPHDSNKANTSTSTMFSFETIAYPEVLFTNISDDNRYITKGDEIIIKLDQDIEDFEIHAVTRPILKMEQYYNKNEHTIHVKILEQSKNYKGFHSLTLFAKHKKQSNTQFYPIYSVTFNTLLPEPEVWPKQFDDRLAIAAKSTAPKIKTGKYVDVNLEAQVTTLFEDGKFVTNFVDSTGAQDSPTPTGEFQIYNKHPYALSDMFQVYLPYWLAFTEDGLYGFHGLIVWPEGHEERPEGGKESEINIGNAVSAGCVRHDAQNSEFLYEWADIGTKVVIY